MEVLFVYLWLKLDTFIPILVAYGFCCTTVIPSVYSIGRPSSYLYGRDELAAYETKWAKIAKRTFISGVVALAIATLLPSSKETAILVGTSYAVALAKSPEGVKVGTLIRKKANQFLDEQINSIPAK